MTDIATVADEAANILETNGHLKNDWGHNGGPRCLGGAVAEAMDNTNIHGKCFTRVTSSVSELVGGDHWDSFIDWNNAPERTAEEVIQVLRDVATKHRSDEFRSK